MKQQFALPASNLSLDRAQQLLKSLRIRNEFL